jgi:hypothetical protein
MAGLFVPLDVNYFEDDKIIDVGPMGELLYVRALAFVKRTGTDGHINANQLQAIAPRITNPRRLADRLVTVGLWQTNGTGWLITAWLKRNQPRAAIHTAKSDAGRLGNHKRWHIPPLGIPTIDCEICVTEGLA